MRSASPASRAVLRLGRAPAWVFAALWFVAAALRAQTVCQPVTVTEGQQKQVQFVILNGLHDVQLVENSPFFHVLPTQFNNVTFFNFTVFGDQAGTGTLVVNSFQPPFSASCNALITVLPDTTPPPPGATTTFFAQGGKAVRNDPVSTPTGEHFDPHPVDLDLGGPLPVVFGRHYAARLERDGNLSSALGRNWLHSFDWKLVQDAGRVRIATPVGRVIQFDKTGGAYTQSGIKDLPFQLVASGPHLVLGDPRNGMRRLFDAAGNLVRIEDGRGNALTLSYAAGRLSQVSDGLGRALSLAYDSQGRLTSVGDGTRTVAFAHSGSDLASATDAAGNVTRYAYDSAGSAGGLLAEKTRPQGNTPWAQAWDGEGRVARQTDADGNVIDFSYQTGETTSEDPSGRTQRHTHNSDLTVARSVDEAGKAIVLGYDAAGRRTAVTDRLGHATTYTYHAASGQLASITHADGTLTTLEYSQRTSGGLSAFDLSRVTHPDGRTDRYLYDASGNVLSRTDRADAIWSFTLNGRGQALTATNPLGGTTVFAYNADGTLASQRDPSGNTVSFAYDGLRRLERITWPDGASRRYTYDELDRIVGLTDERGQQTVLTYDGNGNLLRAVDPLGHATTYAYDDMDRPLRVTDPLGAVASRTYDRLGRLATQRDRNGNTATFSYDAVGRPSAARDPEGNEWTLGFDAEGVPSFAADPLANPWLMASNRTGRVTRVRSPEGNRTIQRYDALGRPVESLDPQLHSVVRVLDPRGMVTDAILASGAIHSRYARNGLGQITAATDPNGGVWQWRFDPQGRPTSRTDPLGRVTTFEYDSRSRVARMVLPAGLGTREYSYDPGGLLTRRRASDGTDIAYAYDAAGRLVSASGLSLAYDANGAITQSNGVASQYDAGGRMTRVTIAPGKVVRYAYDRRGLLTEVRDWEGGVTAFDYDAAGRLLEMTRPNGVATRRAFDRDGRLLALDHGSLAALSFVREASGRIVQANRELPLEAAPSPGIEDHAYDAASQLADPGHTYDALGRLTGDGTLVFGWDLASRLLTVAAGGATTSFAYDAFDRRTSRTRGGVTRSYTWNYAFATPAIVAEREAGAVLRSYVTTPAGRLLHSVEADGSRRFYHFDEAGHTLFLTGDDGEVLVRYAYGPTGELLSSQLGAALQAGRLAAPDGEPFDNPFASFGGLGALGDATSPPASTFVFPLGGASPVFPLGQHTGAPQLFAGSAPESSYRLDASSFFNTGSASHELKFGAGYRQAEVQSLSTWGGTQVLGGEAPFLGGGDADYTGAYLQDTLTVGNLTLNLGLRFDLPGSGREAPHQKPVGDAAFEWPSLTPRIGLTYALGADRSTLLRASYSRFADQLHSGAFSTLMPPSYHYAYFNHPGQMDFPDSALDAPITDEMLLGVEHAILPEFVVGLSVTSGRYAATLDQAFRLEDTHIFSSSFYLTGMYSQLQRGFQLWPDGATGPGSAGPAVPRPEEEYLGASLTFNKRLANRWLLRGNVAWQDWEWGR